LAQAVNVGLGGAGAFRRNKTSRADKGLGLIGLGDESDIRQLGHAVDKDNVGRVHVTVDQAVFVKRREGQAQGNTQFQTFLEGKLAPQEDFLVQRFGAIGLRVN